MRSQLRFASHRELSPAASRLRELAGDFVIARVSISKDRFHPRVNAHSFRHLLARKLAPRANALVAISASLPTLPPSLWLPSSSQLDSQRHSRIHRPSCTLRLRLFSPPIYLAIMSMESLSTGIDENIISRLPQSALNSIRRYPSTIVRLRNHFSTRVLFQLRARLSQSCVYSARYWTGNTSPRISNLSL
jgi:hypothetical protein